MRDQWGPRQPRTAFQKNVALGPVQVRLPGPLWVLSSVPKARRSWEDLT